MSPTERWRSGQRMVTLGAKGANLREVLLEEAKGLVKVENEKS